MLIFLYNVFEAFAKKREAGANPWGDGATTLEWQLSSPPPFHQWGTAPAHQVIVRGAEISKLRPRLQMC